MSNAVRTQRTVNYRGYSILVQTEHQYYLLASNGQVLSGSSDFGPGETGGYDSAREAIAAAQEEIDEAIAYRERMMAWEQITREEFNEREISRPSYYNPEA